VTVSDETELRVVASPAALRFIGEAGGMLFVWPTRSRSFRLALTLLEASCEPPSCALEYRRIEVGSFLLFFHPSLRELPSELHVDIRGRYHPRVEAYWDGLAFVI
jgi:hypothetical protein